jgi:hypothetical protein
MVFLHFGLKNLDLADNQGEDKGCVWWIFCETLCSSWRLCPSPFNSSVFILFEGEKI